MTATTTQQNSHFNLHVSGVGYINRVRWVTPDRKAGRRAEPFLACSISALRGDSDKPDYTYFDLRVSGQEAIDIVDKIAGDLEHDRKVVVSFRIGDIYPHHYERDVVIDGRKTGEKEIASLIKGRLLLINTVTVDGERVYTRPDNAPVDPAPEGEGSSDEGQPQGAQETPEASPQATSVYRNQQRTASSRPARVTPARNGQREAVPA